MNLFAYRNQCTGPEYEFTMGGIRGMRIWRLSDEFALTALWSEYIWNVNMNTAVCNSSPFVGGHGAVVHEECGCGFYGYHADIYHAVDRFEIMSRGWYATHPREYSTMVAGLITGWGRTLVGEYGFRSEFAKVDALCSLPVGIKPFSPEGIYTRHLAGLPVFNDVNVMVKHFPLGEVLV